MIIRCPAGLLRSLFRSLAAALATVVLLSAPLGQLRAQDDAQSTTFRESVSDSVIRIYNRLNEQLTEDKDRYEAAVSDSVRSHVRSCFSQGDPIAAGASVFQTVNISTRLPSRKYLLDELTDSVYNFNPEQIATTDLAYFLFSAGILEFSRGDRKAALMWFDSTLSFPLHEQDSGIYASAMKVRGYVHRYEHNWDAAVADFEGSLNLIQLRANAEIEQVDILSAWGATLVEAGRDPMEALPMCEEAVARFDAHSEKMANWVDSYNVFTNYARILGRAGRLDEATAALNRARGEVRRYQDDFRGAIVNAEAAKIYFEAGLLDSAEHNALRSRLTFREVKQPAHETNIMSLIADIARERGNFERADLIFQERVALMDSVREVSQVHTIRAMREEHTRRQQRIALSLERQRAQLLLAQRRSNQLLTVLAIVVAALSVVVLLWLYRNHRRRGEHAERLECLVKQRTASLEAQTEELRHSKNELERFAFIASHDLKTPVRNVISFLGLIDRKLPTHAREHVADYLDYAQRYARQLDHITTDVLEFSQAGQAENIVVTDCEAALLARQAVERLTPSRGEAIWQQVEITGSAPLHTSAEHVIDLLTCLIENALKYNDSVMPRVSVAIASEGDERSFSISVTDNGIGIEAAYHEQVFDLFKRLHVPEAYGGGTGLGLALARKSARAIGLEVDLTRSAPGEGSTFVIRPADQPRSESTNTEGHVARAAQ